MFNVVQYSVLVGAATQILSAPISQNQPKVIYFDFGGVVANPDPQVQLDFLVNEVGFPKEAIQDSPYFRWMQLHPDEVEYLNQMALKYQIDLNLEVLDQYRKVKRNSLQETEGILQLAQALRQMGYEVNLISNIRDENLDLLQPFIGAFDNLVHCPKDAGKRQEAWELEWQKRGFIPSELLLIDDQFPNISEAQTLGLQVVQFQDFDTLLKELARRAVFQSLLI